MYSLVQFSTVLETLVIQKCITSITCSRQTRGQLSNNSRIEESTEYFVFLSSLRRFAIFKHYFWKIIPDLMVCIAHPAQTWVLHCNLQKQKKVMLLFIFKEYALHKSSIGYLNLIFSHSIPHLINWNIINWMRITHTQLAAWQLTNLR